MKTSLILKLLAVYAFAGFAGYQSVAFAVWQTTTPLAQESLPIQNPANYLAQAQELFSTTSGERSIATLTITEAIPATGKFIAADLVNMKLALYNDGEKISEFPIQSKGRPGTPWETPSGFYNVKTKELSHFSSIGRVYMPYSMQFYGNYFIHGWTHYPDGTPTASSYSGGCIKLLTPDAQEVFAFASVGTDVFVYDTKEKSDLPPLTLAKTPLPTLSAETYLVADIETGDVYAEKNAQLTRPIASITKLMTALVANESISLYRELNVAEGGLVNPPAYENTTPKTFVVGDLLYPLLMQSSNLVAQSIASYYGTGTFISWMNATALAHGMKNTTFADASGASENNISTADDLFRLTSYIAHKKAFIFTITKTGEKTITATDGTAYAINNLNTPANKSPYIGGKTGYTTAAGETMLSIIEVPDGDSARRVAILVLGSTNRAGDTTALGNWLLGAARTSQNSATENAACASCAQNETPEYRKVEVPSE
jgi:D-alanyl-D-alanine carboxypeptidase